MQLLRRPFPRLAALVILNLMLMCSNLSLSSVLLERARAMAEQRGLSNLLRT